MYIVKMSHILYYRKIPYLTLQKSPNSQLHVSYILHITENAHMLRNKKSHILQLQVSCILHYRHNKKVPKHYITDKYHLTLQKIPKPHITEKFVSYSYKSYLCSKRAFIRPKSPITYSYLGPISNITK